MDIVEIGLEERISSLISIGIIAFAILLIAYSLGFFRIPKKVIPHTRISDKYLAGAFIIFIFVQAMASSILNHFWSYAGSASIGWVHVIATFITITALYIYFFYLPVNERRQIWNNGKVVSPFADLKQYFFGLASWIVAYPIVIFVSQAIALWIYYYFNESTVNQEVVKVLAASINNWFLFAFLIFTTTIIAPLIEELLFRGFLQSRFKNIMGRVPAVMWTSFIFAMFHFSSKQGLSNIEFIGALFVFSCFLGFVYERQNSLWASIGLHSAFNAFSILLIIFD